MSSVRIVCSTNSQFRSELPVFRGFLEGKFITDDLGGRLGPLQWHMIVHDISWNPRIHRVGIALGGQSWTNRCITLEMRGGYGAMDLISCFKTLHCTEA